MPLNFAIGTTFVPISIKTQINEADSIVYGEVISKESQLVDETMVATKYVLKLDQWIGVENTDGREFEVLTPGGEVDGKAIEVPGTASMNLGEKVVLLLGKDENKNFWVKNLGLGKYSAKKIGNGTILVNQIFPLNPEIGQIKLSYFFSLAERLKEEKFKQRFRDKYEIQAEKQVRYKKLNRKGRKIASIDSEESKSNRTGPIWLVIILGLMGGITAAFYSRFFD